MTRDHPATATHADSYADLPAVTKIRTRVRVGDEDAVVVRFANGPRLRFQETDDGVEEAWFPPDTTEPTVTNVKREDVTAETLALRVVGEYLSFNNRRRAAFVWGKQNLEALLGE